MKVGDLVQLILNTEKGQYVHYTKWYLKAMLDRDPMLLVSYVTSDPTCLKVIHKGKVKYINGTYARLYNESR